jgi:hypothetical protein
MWNNVDSYYLSVTNEETTIRKKKRASRKSLATKGQGDNLLTL